MKSLPYGYVPNYHSVTPEACFLNGRLIDVAVRMFLLSYSKL